MRFEEEGNFTHCNFSIGKNVVAATSTTSGGNHTQNCIVVVNVRS